MTEREIDSERFVEKFCSVPEKLDKKIDLKKLINEQLEGGVYKRYRRGSRLRFYMP